MTFRRVDSFFYVGNDGFHGDGTGRVVEIESAINLLLRRKHTGLLVKINPVMRVSLRRAVLDGYGGKLIWADGSDHDPEKENINISGYRVPVLNETLSVVEDQACPVERFAIESTSPF